MGSDRFQSPVERALFAVVAVAAGTIIAVAMEPLTATPSLAPLIGAVALVAWLGGLWPGLVACGLSAASASYLVFPPRFSLTVTAEGQVWRLFLVLAVSVGVAGLGGWAHRSTRRATLAERTARSSETVLDTLLSAAPIGFALFDSRTRYVRLNEFLARLDARTIDDHLGRRPTEIFPKPVGRAIEERVASVIATGEPVLNLAVSEVPPSSSKELMHFLVSYYPIPVEGGESGVGALIFDITDQRRRHDEQARIAHALQTALAPPQLPRFAGLDVGVAYSPLGEGDELGGDFYDLIRLGDASRAALVGDVCGKGPEAGALGGMTRQTARALADPALSPAAILTSLNDALIRQRGTSSQFVTAIYARLEEAGGVLDVSLSSAGHPPALVLRRDGSVESLGEAGTPLGVGERTTLRDVATVLRGGETLVLYTDGVTESRHHGEFFGEEGIRRILRSSAGLDAQAVADAICDAARRFSATQPRDDIAVMVLRPLADAGRRDDGPPRAPAHDA